MWLIAAAALAAALVVLPGLFRRMRGAWLRASPPPSLVLALAQPGRCCARTASRCSTVVALVVDKSASQTPRRPRQGDRDAASAELQKRLADFRGIEVRTVEAGGRRRQPVDGTHLFGPLAAALADVPPERIGAVIMLTDGEVHDIPADAPALLAGAPLHVLLSGHDGERDRRIVIDAAPRFGIVGENADDPAIACSTTASRRAAAPVRVTVTRDGNPLSVETVTPGAPSELTVDIAHGGQNILEFEAEPLAGELTADQQPRRRRRSRASARTCACCSSPASRTPASAPGATCSSPTPRSTSSTSPSCARRRSRTARRSTSCR